MSVIEPSGIQQSGVARSGRAPRRSRSGSGPSSPTARAIASLRRELRRSGETRSVVEVARQVFALHAAPEPALARRLVASLLGGPAESLPERIDAGWLRPPEERRVADLPLATASFAIVDLETTGLSADACTILEFGAVRVRAREIADDFASLVRPAGAVPRRITALTGIDDAAVAHAPPLPVALRRFHAWMALSPRAPFVAHNAGFDAGFVRRALAREGLPPLAVPVLCSRKLARRIAPEVGRFGLDALSAHFGVSNVARHRALGDAAATARIWLELLDLARDRLGAGTLGDLLDLQEAPPRPHASCAAGGPLVRSGGAGGSEEAMRVSRPVARPRRAAASARRVRVVARAALWALVALASSALASLPAAAEPVRPPPERFDTVVIDAGHGGEDEGARSDGGLAEKELVLDVSRRLAQLLRERGLRVVLTRERDEFVPLETRTSVANDARGDLFVSIHANAASGPGPRGIETYFVSLEASDAAARRLAERENQAFAGPGGRAPGGGDPLLALLGDMMANEHMRESNDFARLAQRELSRVDPGRSRGVKQAPFVVLMGVQMPATLVEIGFLTNPEDEGVLQRGAHRDRIAQALARAVVAFGERFDRRRGAVAGWAR